MNVGSLQARRLRSSALLPLPRIIYARLASTHQVTRLGRREGVTLSAGAVVLLGEPEERLAGQCSQPWQQQHAPEPMLENPL